MKDNNERFTLTTNKFMSGIDALKIASLIMRDVFEFMPKPDDTMYQDDLACEDEAMWAILETIQVYPPYPKEVSWNQRVLHIGKNELEYRNSDNIVVCWKREIIEDTPQWIFWVVVPPNYQEPNAGGLMGPRLERAGFTRELLVA